MPEALRCKRSKRGRDDRREGETRGLGLLLTLCDRRREWLRRVLGGGLKHRSRGERAADGAGFWRAGLLWRRGLCDDDRGRLGGLLLTRRGGGSGGGARPSRMQRRTIARRMRLCAWLVHENGNVAVESSRDSLILLSEARRTSNVGCGAASPLEVSDAESRDCRLSFAIRSRKSSVSLGQKVSHRPRPHCPRLRVHLGPGHATPRT